MGILLKTVALKRRSFPEKNKNLQNYPQSSIPRPRITTVRFPIYFCFISKQNFIKVLLFI